MEDIYPIYKNAFGMSFQWKRQIAPSSFGKIQIIFRDTGFFLTIGQIKEFHSKVNEAKQRGACSCCNDLAITARSILLKTPFSDVDLAVNEQELDLICELIQGTLFHIDLDTYLNQVCSN